MDRLDEEKVRDTEVLPNGYKIFLIGKALYCTSLNPQINQELSENENWFDLGEVGQFRIFSDRFGFIYWEQFGAPPEIEKFFEIFNRKVLLHK